MSVFAALTFHEKGTFWTTGGVVVGCCGGSEGMGSGRWGRENVGRWGGLGDGVGARRGG